jgi:prophage antirepressor-like protein
MDNLLVKQFQENNITIYGTHENPLFKAKDIGDLLGMTNIRETIKDYNNNQRCVRATDTAFGKKDTIFLTEQGLYKVLMKSRKPIAEKFQDWICEVVEEIRKTGEYKNKKEIEHKTKNTLFIDQYQDKSIIYLGLVEETEQQKIVKYGYTSDTKSTLKRHKETYGDFFHYVYAVECKEHYKLEKKIQKHNDLLSRHIKNYNGEQKQELIRLDKNFSIKNLINLIMKIKETMESSNEIRLKEIELDNKKEETKQKEEETKQKELDLEIIKQELKQKEFDLAMKKLDFELEMKKLEINNLYKNNILQSTQTQQEQKQEQYTTQIKQQTEQQEQKTTQTEQQEQPKQEKNKIRTNDDFVKQVQNGSNNEYVRLNELYEIYIDWHNKETETRRNIQFLSKRQLRVKVDEHVKLNLKMPDLMFHRYCIDKFKFHGWKFMVFTPN